MSRLKSSVFEILKHLLQSGIKKEQQLVFPSLYKKTEYDRVDFSINLGWSIVYSITCLKPPLKKLLNIGFQDRLLLNAGQKYCRMLQESILQYFRPSLSYHISLRPLFCLFFEWPLKTGFTVY